MKKIILVVLFVAAMLGLGLLLFKFSNQNPAGQAATEADPVKNDFSHVPTGGQLLGNLKKASLDALNAEGNVLHIHQHLDIIINGQQIAIPANIGVGGGFISPIHTHDGSGILHVESPVKKDFTLGQFFKEWNVDLSDKQIGNNVVDDARKLIVGVNGSTVENPSDYVLKEHDEIEIWYGKKDENPTLIKDYKFPAEL